MPVLFLQTQLHLLQSIQNFFAIPQLILSFLFAQYLILTLFLKSQLFGFLDALSLTGLLFAVTLQLLCCAAASRLSNYSILLGSASKHISLAILFSVQIKADSNFTKPLSFFHTHSFVFFDVLHTGIALDSQNDEIQNSPHGTQNSCQLLLAF